MAEAAAKPSESMEDILQSIKRIIEDDSVTDAKPPAEPEPAAGDVLELTQAIREDGSVASLPPLPSFNAAANAEPPAPQPAPAPTPAPMTAAKPVAPEPPTLIAVKAAPDEGLVSEQATQAAIAALKPFTQAAHKDYSIPHIPSSSLRNGHTVEDLVLEALKPMLKSWLDEHLPLIVQKIVEKEVKRIVTFHQD